MPQSKFAWTTSVLIASAVTLAFTAPSRAEPPVGGATDAVLLHPQPGHALMGVYCGTGTRGAAHTDSFGQWVGQPIYLGHDSMPDHNATWDHISGRDLVGNRDWLLQPWARWKQAAPGRRLVLSVAILPGGLDLKGPQTGTAANIPVSLEQGAQGAYNQYFTALAQRLIASGHDDALLRLGWEMNGDWYTWRCGGHEEAFAGYWRQIVTTLRAVPGQHFLFVFNPDCDPRAADLEKAWPGDAYVDLFGIDLYDWSWLADTYPIPAAATPAERLARHRKVWTELHMHGNNDHRLAYLSNFARLHHKPLCFPEWGLCAAWSKGHGGGDNPYFVERMYQFIMDPQNHVAFHSYFNMDGGQDHEFRLAPDPEGKVQTEFPNAAARFKELFGNPAVAPGGK